MIPDLLHASLKPITVVAGHYGTGKTNFSVNVACDLADGGAKVALVDLDVVNPYFRASEQRCALEAHGVDLVAPVFAEAGSSLDVPSLTGRIVPVLQQAGPERFVVVDVGGDDVGATALGRFARHVRDRDYAFLLVANCYRNLVQDPADALANLREIEHACGLRATGVVSNAHLKDQTTAQHVLQGQSYACEVARLAGVPHVATCVAQTLADFADDERTYRIKMYVKSPWER